jgi:hypothetical protein
MNRQRVQWFEKPSAPILRMRVSALLALCLRHTGERRGGGHFAVGASYDCDSYVTHRSRGICNWPDRYRDCRQSNALGR